MQETQSTGVVTRLFRVYKNGRRVEADAASMMAACRKAKADYNRRMFGYAAWLTAKPPVIRKPVIVKARMHFVKLSGGPLSGVKIYVENHSNGHTPDTLPLMHNGKAGHYIQGGWEWLDEQPHPQPQPAPITVTTTHLMPMPVQPPITIPVADEPAAKPEQSAHDWPDMPPPAAHLADFEHMPRAHAQEWRRRYRMLYCISHGLPLPVKINEHNWVNHLHLLTVEPDGSYRPTEKAIATYLTQDPGVTDRYLASIGA